MTKFIRSKSRHNYKQLQRQTDRRQIESTVRQTE